MSVYTWILEPPKYPYGIIKDTVYQQVWPTFKITCDHLSEQLKTTLISFSIIEFAQFYFTCI